MAKTKTSHRKQKSSSSKPENILHSTTAPLIKSTKPTMAAHPTKSIEQLLEEASELLEHGSPETALPLAEEALRRLESTSQQQMGSPDVDAAQDELEVLIQQAMEGKATLPQALTVAAEIELALGDVPKAQRYFMSAVQGDPDGALISAEPYLWLAQLSEEGGKDSVMYYDRACLILRNEIELLEVEESLSAEGGRETLEARRGKLADALCAMAEVYMTDLSWEEDAEQECERLVTEAVSVCPERLSAGCLQVLASVRISQERVDEAKDVLKKSMAVWRGVGVEDLKDVEFGERMPDFATRVSLCRLLMEVEEEGEAMSVLEGLVKEDDQSVECWYLGGWCQILIAQKQTEAVQNGQLEKAKEWLDMCLRLYEKTEYEDDRLKEHAEQLSAQIREQLGLEAEDDDGWEDEEEIVSEDDEVELNGHDVEEDGDVEMG